MEEYGQRIRGGKQDSSEEAKRLMHFLNTFNSGSWYGYVKWEHGVPGHIVLRIPAGGERYLREILDEVKPNNLPTLANEVANTICDTKTKEAFKKFANLLIEKLEKK